VDSHLGCDFLLSVCVLMLCAPLMSTPLPNLPIVGDAYGMICIGVRLGEKLEVAVGHILKAEGNIRRDETVLFRSVCRNTVST